jgi:hypothetical protein
MARVVRSTAVATADGLVYDVNICGRQRIDGRWEGWIEFAPSDDSPVLRTPRETTQPSVKDLEYWASGLTPVYLDGALTRAIHSARVRHVDTVVPAVPYYDEPAPDPHAAPAAAAVPERRACEPSASEFVDVEGAVLDPFSVYAKGEDILRQKLGVLSAHHLRGIARGYRLVPGDFELESFTEPELIQLIMGAVRTRCAA